MGHRGVARWAAQCIHRLLELAVEIPGVEVIDLFLQNTHLGKKSVKVCIGLGHQRRNLIEAIELCLGFLYGKLNVSENGKTLIERRLLQKNADGCIGCQSGFTVARGVDARHDLQHG